jgi:hypothetical protein
VPQTPPELARLLITYDEEPASLRLIATELRAVLRQDALRALGLHERLHLSGREGDRLGATLWLERWPAAEYVWWLAERVWVESPAVGFLAAQALIAAALRLPRLDLPRLRAAAQRAADRLVSIMNTEAALPAPVDVLPVADAVFDVVSRKREVDTAITLIDMRLVRRREVMTPEELEQFLAAMETAFTRGELDGMSVGLLFPLRRFARDDDPTVLCIVYLICKAREGRWERDLIEAAHRLKPTVQLFDEMSTKYKVQAVAV